jgi:hypothetical protein
LYTWNFAATVRLLSSKWLCKLCHGPQDDQRHVAWEQSKDVAAEHPKLPRELA